MACMYAISQRVDSMTMAGGRTTVLPVPAPPERRYDPENGLATYRRCSGWRKIHHAPKSPASMTRHSSSLALDEREIGLRPRALERCENVGVRIGGGLGGCEL